MATLKVSQTPIINYTAPVKRAEIENEKQFTFELNRVSENNAMERLGKLADEISVSGNKLAEHIDIKDLKNYKALVGEFIGEVVTNSLEFSRENFLDKRGRHRVFGIVRQINKKVDDLAQEVLKKEKDHILILDKIDEIKGLILDVVV